MKRFENPPAAARRQVRLSHSGARTVAGVEWAWMHQLREDGIACASPVALGEEVRGKSEVRSVLVSEAVAGESLERWMGRWNELEKNNARDVLLSVARLVSRFHQKGYIHRDLYLSHVFYDAAARSDDALRLIDLQRVLRPRWRKLRWIVKDLAALNFSAPQHCISRVDRVRWLREYLGTRKLNAAGKRLAYRVIGKSMSIARRELPSQSLGPPCKAKTTKNQRAT